MKTSLINPLKNQLIQLNKIQALTHWLGQQLAAQTAPAVWGEVSIIFLDDVGITQTNREYFGKNRPTDVISFRYDPIPGEDDLLTGDLLINVDRAIAEGTARGNINYELALYIAHGFDHLSGAEDNTPEKHKNMRTTETAWLRIAEEQGLLTGLFKNK